MNAYVRIHLPQTQTHLPHHELTARRRRLQADQALTPHTHRKPTPAVPRGRRTVDTRWNPFNH